MNTLTPLMISILVCCGCCHARAVASTVKNTPPSSLSLQENINETIDTGNKLAEKAYRPHASTYMGRFSRTGRGEK